VTTAIRIDALSKTWPDGTVALRDVSLRVEAGEVVAILGGSGAGKSTLLRCASRLVEPTEGRIEIGGADLRAARGRALAKARASIGFVFQQFNLVRSYTALQNVLLGRIAHVGFTRGLLGWFGPHDQALARRALADVGLTEKAGALARELSGGQQQRVAIARAFAQQPKAIFADEPTASLDPKLADTVMELLRRYGKRESVPVLVNVHTIEHARRFADRAIGLRRGAVLFDGSIDRLDDAALEVIYGDAGERS
jgi:phosphonate transport system ATP-binding protein